MYEILNKTLLSIQKPLIAEQLRNLFIDDGSIKELAQIIGISTMILQVGASSRLIYRENVVFRRFSSHGSREMQSNNYVFILRNYKTT